ncbi:MAG: ATP-binding protein, partial [Promethearchaeota archaeon]
VVYYNPASDRILANWGFKDGNIDDIKILDNIGRCSKDEKNIQFDAKVLENIFSFTLIPIKNTLFVNVYAWDITEREKTNRDLIQSKNKYFNLYSNMLYGYAYHKIITDPEGKPIDYEFLDINPAFIDITRITRQMAIGKRVTELFPTIREDPFDWIGKYGNVALSGNPISFESYFGSHNKNFAVSAYCPEPNHFVALFSDITEKLKAKKELNKLNKEFLHVFNSVRPMCVISQDFQIIKVNNSFCSFFNQDPSTLLKSKCYDIVTNSNCHSKNCPLVQIGRERIRCDLEIEYKNISERNVNCFISAAPFIDSSEKLIGIVETFTDITQIRSLETQLMQSQKMDALGRFAGGIAHDFNNLLTVIMGFSQIIDLSMQDTDPHKADLHEIIEASNRASALTEQILTFSRKQKMEMKSFDLIILLREVESILHRLIGADIDLKTIYHLETAVIYADQSQVGQLFMNLATNARDAMPQGGKLIIELQSFETSTSDIVPYLDLKSGEYVHIQITDSGSGIKKADLSHIFEPFFTTKDEGKGTGLGLSIVYGIVKQIGGEICVFSEETIGTSFHIYIPLSKGDLDLKESSPKLLFAPHLYGDETILLVEDDRSLRKFTHTILHKFGYHVLEAENGIGALEIFENNKDEVDLILADIIMPKMGGIELFQALEKQSQNQNILIPPILYMSGYSLNTSFLEPRNISSDVFIQKPFKIDDLVIKVRELLDLNTLMRKNMKKTSEKRE